MPIGLKFQRKHRRLGYMIKYFSYILRRRDVLQKKKSFGDELPNETIYIIKPDYQDGVEGVLSLVFRQILYINHAKKLGYIPFVDWQNYRTQYYDGEHNAWDYFFKQPSDIDIDVVYRCKNVFLSGWTFKDLNPKGLFGAKVFFDYKFCLECSNLLENTIQLSDEVNQIVEYESKMLDIENCIGLYIRGTDYVALKPSGEYVQPSVEQVIPIVEDFLKKYKNNSGVFLVTEDGKIYDQLYLHFGKQIKIVSFDNFIRNYQGKNVLSKSSVLNENIKRRGQDYLAKMVLLSKCKYLISSITQGSKFSYVLNGGKYLDQYIFDLGLYP